MQLHFQALFSSTKYCFGILIQHLCYIKPCQNLVCLSTVLSLFPVKISRCAFSCNN